MGFIALSNDKVSLYPLDETFATEIYNNNKGNVKDYFCKFNNLRDVKEWIKASLTLVNYGAKIESVILSLNSEFLGMIALDNLNEDVCELKLWIAQDAQKKGIATSAAYLIIDYFNSEYPEKQLRYIAKNENEPSIALANKLGLIKTRTYRDDSNKPYSVFVLKQTI